MDKLTDEAVALAIADIVQDVAELPDRTSPEDWPEAMLVTSEELHDILTNRLAALDAARGETADERQAALVAAVRDQRTRTARWWGKRFADWIESGEWRRT